MKFRKKPVVIEAIQFKTNDLSEMVKAWGPEFSKKVVEHHAVHNGIYDSYFTIQTLEGKLRADFQDWIIKGVAGEFYPCKPKIFDQTYEQVND